METLLIPRALAVRILNLLETKNIMNAVYISPAQQLRNAADELEQKERDIAEFRSFLNGEKSL